MSKNAATILNDEQFAEMMNVALIAQPAQTAQLSAEQKAILEGTASKSDKIRKLLASGMKRGEVAKVLGIRYQHVRNVELTPLKKAQ
jgi:hypothetical protein